MKQPSAKVQNIVKELIAARNGRVMLNIGCGTDYKAGWINIDNNSDNNIEQLDLNWDLRNPLPFDDHSVDYVFSEHFFEHLTPEEGQAVMKDIIRVLKRKGVMRAAMPDLEGVIHNYLHVPLDQDPVIREYGLDFVKTRAEWLNMSLRWWGHQWLYDWDELERRLKEAGFTKMKRCELRESRIKELRNLEVRDGSLLIAEASV